MDEIDAQQQTQIDKLEVHADTNQTTDRIQWIAIAVILCGFLLYFNAVLVGILNNQTEAVMKIADKCH